MSTRQLHPPARAVRLGRAALLSCAAIVVPLAGVSVADDVRYRRPPPIKEPCAEPGSPGFSLTPPPSYDPCAPKEAEPCAPAGRDTCEPREHEGCGPRKPDPCEPEEPEEYEPRPEETCGPPEHDEANEPDDLRRSKSDHELREASPKSLSEYRVPEPPNLKEFVRDKKAAIALGKALFWDQRVGSQGQACASCHFQAGADPRAKNQLSPGLLAGDLLFQPTADGGAGGPNYTLKPADFPFHRKVDPTRNDSKRNNTLFDTNDVTSSQGVKLAAFLGLLWDPVAGQFSVHDDETGEDATFRVGLEKVRRVEPRNTPTVVNAVFNHRNFWDGRANFIFNGVDPFGERSNKANRDQGVYELDKHCKLRKVKIEIPYGSLASQATGPPLNDFEMSSGGKQHRFIGRLLARHYALSLQTVHHEDSVLAGLRRSDGIGLYVPYRSLVQRAFQPRWWASKDKVRIDGDYFDQYEANFSLFFGLAVQLYEATLVSTRSRFDSFVKGNDHALTHEEKFGLEVFLNQGKCVNCHSGPTFSGASIPVLLQSAADDPLDVPGGTRQQPIERMEMARGVAVYDAGFYNIGVRPTKDDLGVGGKDPFGNPLSFSQQLSDRRLIDRFVRDQFDPKKFEVDPGKPVKPGERTAVLGAFKTPSLRNVELTAPFMHNGGMLTLEQVVEFYARGGDFHHANLKHLDPDVGGIDKINGKPRRIRAVAAFLRALTDHRVQDESGPFDHPSLVVPNGHVGDEVACTSLDEPVEIPAVGKRGRRAYGLPKIVNFLDETD